MSETGQSEERDPSLILGLFLFDFRPLKVFVQTRVHGGCTPKRNPPLGRKRRPSSGRHLRRRTTITSPTPRVERWDDPSDLPSSEDL